MPKIEHAIGISISDPPAIPDVPHAASVAIIQRINIRGKLAGILSVFTADIAIIAITTAAPSIFIIEPRGMVTE